MYRLQRFNEANGLKNFRLFPQNSFGRKSIRIDTFTMRVFVNHIHNKTGQGKRPLDSQKTEHVKTWAPCVNYFKFQTKHRWFDFSMVTDAVSATVQCVHMKNEWIERAEFLERLEEKRKRFRSNARDLLTKNEYDKCGGIDEGSKCDDAIWPSQVRPSEESITRTREINEIQIEVVPARQW